MRDYLVPLFFGGDYDRRNKSIRAFRWNRCYKKGIKPLSEGGNHNKSNLISLCKSCNARIHAERGDRWNKK